MVKKKVNAQTLAFFFRRLQIVKSLPSRRVALFLTAFLWWLSGAFQIWWLGWLALAPFFVFLEELPPQQRFRFGYATGFVSFWLINWWLVPTISRGAPAIGAPILVGFFLSLVAVTFIAAIHAFQVACVTLFWRGQPWRCVVGVALAWALGDFVRTLSPLAHEWGALAFSQTSDLPLLQIAAVLGQHGLTFICALVSACAAFWWRTRKQGWLLWPAVLLVALHGWGFYRLQRPIEGKTLRVLIVQTAVSSLSKSQMATGEEPFPQALRLTAEALAQSKNAPPDLIVWPETTANLRRFGPSYSGLDWAVLREAKWKVPLLFGAQTFDEQERSWNEAILLTPDGKTQVRAKTRLVPFGERAPLVAWLPFLQVFAPRPMIEPGEGPKAFALGSQTLDSQICFETCFPTPTRGQLLVFVTNDEWFTGTEAPRQHRAMAILRAVENAVPVVQSANGGYSCVVDARGRLKMTTRFGLPQTLSADVSLPP